MLHALTQFSRDLKGRSYTSIEYEIIKAARSESMSGENNPLYGKGYLQKGIKKSDHIIKSLRDGAKEWRENGGITDEYKQKISCSLKGKKKPPGFGKLLSKSIKGKNHHRFKGFYHTPFGKLTASTEVEDRLPNQLVRRWCKNPDREISFHSYNQNEYLQSLGIDVVGKTYRDIGFWYENIIPES